MLQFLLPMLAGKGVELIKTAIENATDEGVEKVNNFVKEKTGIDLFKKKELSPEEVEKLKQLERQEKEFFEKIKLEYYKADLADKQSARDMQKEALGQNDVFSKRFVYYFAAVWSIFCMVYIGIITLYPIPATNQRFADTILGFLLGTIIATIIQFFYGSSRGSDEKTYLLIKSKKD